MVKLVILDYDDTLCMTEEGCFYLENEIATAMGFPPMTRETHRKNWGKPIREAIRERIPGIDVEEFMKRQEDLVPKYEKEGKLDNITLENLAVLDKLRDSGKKIAILTSRHLSEVKHLLFEGHPLRDRIDTFYHKDNSLYFKPDPKVFNQILSDFNIKAEDATYVGDSISDAVATNKAGLMYINVLESGLRNRDDFKDLKVDFYAHKFTDILDFILKKD